MSKLSWGKLGVALTAGVFCASGAYADGAEKAQGQKIYNGLAGSVKELAANNAEGAVLSMTETAFDYFLPSLGDDLPEWAKRIEFSGEVQSEGKPFWSVLTVQPLYQSEGNEHTIFTQLSQNRYDYLGTTRDVSNIGLGYRKLFNDNSMMVGVNSFFDYEWKRQHKRFGLGAEAKWYGLDFTTNGYWGLGADTTRDLPGDSREEVLDGYDFELAAQVPYMPWAKVYAKRFFWDTVANSDDIDGWQSTVEMDLHQNVSLEAGWRDDNFSDDETFMKVTYKLGFNNPKKPVAFSSAFISDQAWEKRDMREHTLDKVRRENRIIVERRASGVVITRSN